MMSDYRSTHSQYGNVEGYPQNLWITLCISLFFKPRLMSTWDLGQNG